MVVSDVCISFTCLLLALRLLEMTFTALLLCLAPLYTLCIPFPFNVPPSASLSRLVDFLAIRSQVLCGIAIYPVLQSPVGRYSGVAETIYSAPATLQ
jgi:hypothetical protein